MPIFDGLRPEAIDLAARRLADGGLVAFATETVYGLGARADDDAAVARIFEAKGRPPEHPLIVHVTGPEAARAFAARVSPAAERVMQKLWPGPVSVVLERRPGLAEAAAGGLPTVALRCPSHPVARALLRRAQEMGVAGVAAPSANRFGRVSPTRAEHVVAELGEALTVLDGGACNEGIESAIVDCTVSPPRLLRPGSLPRSMIEDALGQGVGHGDAGSPRVSGSLESHYAPQARVQLVASHELESRALQALSTQDPHALAVLARHRPALPAACGFRAMPDNAREAAHILFDTLRGFDAEERQVVLVERPPDDPDWDGVRDRLTRAAAPR